MQEQKMRGSVIVKKLVRVAVHAMPVLVNVRAIL
jgi:hypothetical protein